MVLRIELLRQIYKLIVPYWTSPEKYVGIMWLSIALIFTGLGVYSAVLLNEWNKVFFSAIQNYDKAAFISSAWHGFMVMILYVAFPLGAVYASSMLEINWRSWLTKFYLNQWLSDQSYYRTQFIKNNVDNPDQRISEDIRQFIELSLSLSLGFLKSIATLGSFIVILWGFSRYFSFDLASGKLYIPGLMVWLALLYGFIGVYFTFKVGFPLIKLDYAKEKYEANFRYSLLNVREYAQQIASQGGEKIEQQLAQQNFDNIILNFKQRLQRRVKINLVNYGYGHFSTIIPIVIAIPKYFSRQINLGDLMQLRSAFFEVQYAITYFMVAYIDIAKYRAVINRLIEFEQIILATKHLTVLPINSNINNYLTIDNLQLFLPCGKRLLGKFSVQLNSGDRLLICGRSGVGKSTLAKALNQMWPYASGEIYRTNNVQQLFIGQKPYLTHGNLKQVICYPILADLVNDEKINQLLDQCDLSLLKTKFDQIADWQNYLSLGEQQKLSFIRVILNQPDIIILDEISSALDETSELKLYQMLLDSLPNSLIISISHRQSLIALHNKQINLNNYVA